jgi:hypothetical protein
MNFKRMFIILLICTGIGFISQVSAESCNIAVDQLLKDINDRMRKSNPSEPQAIPEWANLKWLKDNLGEPLEKTSIEYTLYLWKDYGTIAINGELGGESIGKSGIESKPFEKPTLNSLTEKLGPVQKTTSQILTMNAWKCENNTISALTDEEGSVIDIDVSGNILFGLNSFRVQKELHEAFEQAINKAEKANTVQVLEKYNAYYKTSFKNNEEVQKDIVEKAKVYYQNLRECKKGAYDYPAQQFMGYVYRIASIEGQENNACNVKIYYEIDEAQPDNKIENDCQFSMIKLSVFDDKAAEDMVIKPGKVYSSEDMTEAQKLEWNGCKNLFNGQESMKSQIP